MKNPRVAACIGNIQIEGVAEVMGHPKEIKIEIENEGTKNYITSYSRFKNTVLIKVNPKKVALYKGKGIYQYLDIECEKAFSKGREIA